MKAEHRKELQTNVLADRVGRVVQGMKQAPQKRTMLWLLVVVAVGVVAWLVVRRADVQRNENSANWLMFQDGRSDLLQSLMSQEPTSEQAKAAGFEFLYSQLRFLLRSLAANPKEALKGLDRIEGDYSELAKQCKDDKVFYPEALYSRAVILEARTIKDDDSWKAALTLYKELADNHKESAFGKFARKRVEVLNNEASRKVVLEVYRDLRFEFVREERVPLLPSGHPDISLPPKLPPIE